MLKDVVLKDVGLKDVVLKDVVLKVAGTQAAMMPPAKATLDLARVYLLFNVACAAAKRAIGTRNGLQLT